ncbi:MAG: UDP-N-acetylglucosamine--LPS N-acetylglucosamine transferase [Acidimicrobiia bacterium]|nr:UDP-N-acetylglucosamine--LPS N-acetylglucosamine transferase [Acidimicrobiia bacterium]
MATKPVRALLITSNGAGMGHLSRMLAVALAAGPGADATLLSLSVALPTVTAHGLAGEYCPSTERRFMPDHLWHRYLRRRLVALAEEIDAQVVAFDGVAPYPGLIASRRHLSAVPMVWIRRGMWRPGVNDHQLAKSALFDLIIEPGDLAAAGDCGPTAGRGDAQRVPPITQVDVIDRPGRPVAAAELGIDPDRPTALVTLGTGLTGDVVGPGGVAVAALLEDRRWQVCVTRSTIAEHAVPVIDPTRVIELRDVYPLARYLGVFDAVVSSAGYNAVHEFLPAGLPTLLIANTATRTDDQVARAQWLADAGLALSALPDDLAAIAGSARMLSDDAVRGDLAASCAALPAARRTGGAAAAARLVMAQPAIGARPVTMSQRLGWLGSAAREEVKRLIGPGATELARTVLGRPPSGGIRHRLSVALTGSGSDAAAAPEVRRLVFGESIPAEQIAAGPVIEHLLAGSSAIYRAARLDIIHDAYRVVDQPKS